MAYKTLVASSATQQRWSYDSNAHTLGELKQEFAEQGIPYEGYAITEGLVTKAELTHDDAEIPVSNRTVTFNGETYSRVFLITNTRKNIASGGYPTNRKEFGEYIKKNNLGAIIKNKYGDNWTRVSTDKLITIFQQYNAGNAEQLEETREELNNMNQHDEIDDMLKEAEKNTAKKNIPNIKSAPHPATVEWFYSGIKAMTKEGTLFTDDVAVLADLTTELYKRLKEEQPVMSESDLEDMLFDARNH